MTRPQAEFDIGDTVVRFIVDDPSTPAMTGIVTDIDDEGHVYAASVSWGHWFDVNDPTAVVQLRRLEK
jgi:hypothetical protein